MRLIDADEFKKQMAAMALTSPSYFTNKVVKLLEIIDKQPTVEAVPVVQGEWVKFGSWAVCSKCNHIMEYNRKSNFCPECGADMRKKV